jgi:hypothetical protein
MNVSLVKGGRGEGGQHRKQNFSKHSETLTLLNVKMSNRYSLNKIEISNPSDLSTHAKSSNWGEDNERTSKHNMAHNCR